MVDEKTFNKCKNICCHICGQPVLDRGTAEYIRTKLKSDILIHDDCIARTTGNNSKKLFA